MPKRIHWKKGMRLTDEVLMASDDCTALTTSQAIALASAGRFGLMPSPRPFQLSLNIMTDHVEVETLFLLATTQAGDLIDLQIDHGLTPTPVTSIPLPPEGDELFLTANLQPGAWQEDADGLIEPQCFFALITPQTALSPHAIPIAHLVREENWTQDTSRFVPPCLFLTCHHLLLQQRTVLLDVLRSILEKTKAQAQSPVKTAISIYWPITQQAFIQLNTAYETMTPAMLQACIQQVIGGFALACDMDEVLHLEDADTFYHFSQLPYHYQKNFLRIRQGIGMCNAISEKIDKFSLLSAAPPPPPREPEPKPDPRRSWAGKKI